MSKSGKSILVFSLIGILILIYKNKGSKKAPTKPISQNQDASFISNIAASPTKPNAPIKPNSVQSNTQTQGNTSATSQQSNTNPFLLPSLQQAAQQVSTFTSGMGNESLYDLFPPNYFVSTSEIEANIANQANTSWQQTQVAQYAIDQALQGNPNFQYSLYELPSGGYGMYVTGSSNELRCPRGYEMGNSNICEWIGS